MTIQIRGHISLRQLHQGQVALQLVDLAENEALIAFAREYREAQRRSQRGGGSPVPIRFPWKLYAGPDSSGITGLVWVNLPRSGPTRQRQERLVRELNDLLVDMTVEVKPVRTPNAPGLLAALSMSSVVRVHH